MRQSNAQRARQNMINRMESGKLRPAMSYRKDTADRSPAELKEIEELITALKRRWDRGNDDSDLVERLKAAGVDVDALNAEYFGTEDERLDTQAAKMTEAVLNDLRDAGYKIGTGIRADSKSRSKKRMTRHGGRQDSRFDGMADHGGELSRRTGGVAKPSGAYLARERMIKRSEGKK